MVRTKCRKWWDSIVAGGVALTFIALSGTACSPGSQDAATAAETATPAETATAAETATPAATAIPAETATAAEATPVINELYPNVIDATVVSSGDRTFNVSATIESAYDTPERYADAWRVVAPNGIVLGVRELTHDHQHEQPFTRSLSNVSIPAGVDSVTIEGRDQESGWGGATVTVGVPSS